MAQTDRFRGLRVVPPDDVNNMIQMSILTLLWFPTMSPVDRKAVDVSAVDGASVQLAIECYL